jgi:hypothetical protein
MPPLDPSASFACHERLPERADARLTGLTAIDLTVLHNHEICTTQSSGPAFFASRDLLQWKLMRLKCRVGRDRSAVAAAIYRVGEAFFVTTGGFHFPVRASLFGA